MNWNVCFRPIPAISGWGYASGMSEYQPPNWRHALRVYGKACRILAEPAIVAVMMFIAGVPWWGFILLLVLWVPLARIRVRELREDWVS